MQVEHSELSGRRTALDSDLGKKIPRESLVSRVAAAVREQVRNGTLQPGMQLKAEVEFARELSVSRPTLREAIRLLTREGLLTVRHGIGTFVTELPTSLHSPLNSMQSMSALIRASGAESGVGRLKVRSIAANSEVASALQLDPGEQVGEIVRVRLMDEKPLAVAYDYIPLRGDAVQVLPLIQTFDGSSIYEFMDTHLRIRLLSSEASFTAVAAGKRHAAMLKVKPGFPLLMVREVHLDQQHRRGLYSTVFHNSALMCFTLVRPGEAL